MADGVGIGETGVRELARPVRAFEGLEAGGEIIVIVLGVVPGSVCQTLLLGPSGMGNRSSLGWRPGTKLGVGTS
jgi:hypothetical protein